MFFALHAFPFDYIAIAKQVDSKTFHTSLVMKLQHLRLDFCDEIHTSTLCSPSSSVSSPTINIKCLCPVSPKLACTEEYSSKIISSLDHRSSESPKADKFSLVQLQDVSPQGGTRWNPAPEQIKMLEELYKGGMRTPNTQQIERITTELGKYGRIEGKNVFYWFQNHKARERQRQKRSAGLLAFDAPPDPILSLFTYHKVEKEEANCSDREITKRRCRRWHDVELDSDEDGTLELFPLHPES